MIDKFKFGYPKACEQCKNLSQNDIALRVVPHYRPGSAMRVMLIGQDPTIDKKPERVKEVLILDDPNSEIRRWLEEIFGQDNFRAFTIYATNLVKCSFPRPPSKLGGLKFLEPYFQNCKEYIGIELLSFKPSLVLTFGEPAH